MDDVYAINVAKSQFREGFNTGDSDLGALVFAPRFTDMSEGRPSRYGEDAGAQLSTLLTCNATQCCASFRTTSMARFLPTCIVR